MDERLDPTVTKPPTAGTPAGPPAAGTLSPVAVIGGGMMGEAIVAGWVSRGVFAAAEISVVDPAPARREALASLGVKVFTQAKEALPGAATVLLAVKPQVIDAVAAEIAPALGSALVISIAAGVTTARLESLLAAGTSVVRVMPNLPMSAGQGMAIISGGAVATDSQVTGARNLFEALGDAVAVDECHQNAA
ncbi:MAG: NAD(P)-binding domain-containing protein, partial [Coriobacteriia bacterium]|nr:NAD(P)-binding domain-containing protein [Coriobacteriia bacterium]